MSKAFLSLKPTKAVITRNVIAAKNLSGKKRRRASKSNFKKTDNRIFHRTGWSNAFDAVHFPSPYWIRVKKQVIINDDISGITVEKGNYHKLQGAWSGRGVSSNTLVTKSGTVLDFFAPKSKKQNKATRAQRAASRIAEPYRWLFKGVTWSVSLPPERRYSSLYGFYDIPLRVKPPTFTQFERSRSRYRKTFASSKFDFKKQSYAASYTKNSALLPRHYPLNKIERSFYLRRRKPTESYRRAGRWNLDKESRRQKSYFVNLLQPPVKVKTINLRQERRRRWPKWKAKRWRKEHSTPVISWEEKQLANKKKQMNNEANSRVRPNIYRKGRWLISKKTARRKQKYVFLRFGIRSEVGEKSLWRKRKRVWPASVPPDYVFPRLSWAAKNVEKSRRMFNVTKTFFRSRAKLAKVSARARAASQKTSRFVHKLKKLFPHHSIDYVLKYRKWHTPRDKAGRPVGRPELTDAELLSRSTQKEFRYQKKQGLLRDAYAEKDSKKKSELMREAMSKDLLPPKYIDPVWNELKRETGYPATLGYRHERTTFRNDFVTNRWWQPVATPSPVRHPFSLVKTDDHPEVFKTSYEYSRYYSNTDFYRNGLFSHRTSNLNRNVSALPLKKVTTKTNKTKSVNNLRFESKRVLDLRHDSNTNEFKNKIITTTDQLLFFPAEKKETSSVNLISKERGTVYQIWVKRQRIKNKTSALLLSSCDQAEGKTRAVYILPFDRPRFPLTGDQGFAYVSAMRRHYRKVRRPRFKLITSLNFKLLRNPLLKEKKVLQEWAETTSAHELKRKQGITLAKNVYISKNWRVVNKKRGSGRTFRAARYSDDRRQGQAFTGVKRRFTRYPIKAKQDERNEVAWTLSPKITGTNKNYMIAVLQVGLAKRAETTKVLDDRKEIRLRFPPAAQVLPSRRERADIKEKYQGFVAKKSPKKFTRYARSVSGTWSLDRYGVARATSTRKQPYKKHGVSPAGENLLLPSRFERSSWAKNLYCLWNISRQQYIKNISDTPKFKRTLPSLIAFRSKVKDHLGRRLRFVNTWDYEKRRKPFDKEDKELYRFYATNRDVRDKKRSIKVTQKVPFIALKRKVHSAFEFKRSWNLFSTVYFALQNKISAKWRRTKLTKEFRPKKPQFKAKTWWYTKGDSKKIRGKKYKRCKTAYPLNLKKWRKYRYENKKNLYHTIKNRSKGSMVLFHQEPRLWVAKSANIKVLSIRQKEVKVNSVITKLKRFAPALSTVRSRLLATTPRELSPVHRSFLSKRTKEIIPKEKIERKIEDARISAYEQYRYTTEVAETTTRFFPALMSWLRKTHFNTNVEPHLNTERLISNVYWSIRFYLSQDFFNARLYRQDSSKRFRVARTKEVYNNSERRFFRDEHAEVMQGRRQPFTITRKKPQWKGGLWFLRYWFPRLYKCHLEDALHFDLLTFTPSDARRVQPSAKAVADWKTLDHGDTDDYAFERRIHGSPNQKITRRFETVLKTSRRQKPTLAGIAPYKIFEGIYEEETDLDFSVTTNFFKKSYSTDFNRYNVKARYALTLDRLTFQRRHVYVTEREAPLKIVAKAYNQTKKITVTHSRRHRSLDLANHPDGAINRRFVRAKSPRSAQYFQRRSKRPSFLVTNFLNSKFLNLQRLRQPKLIEEETSGGREPRYYLSRRGLFAPKFSFLPQNRQVTLKRRVPPGLRAAQQVGTIRTVTTKFRRAPKKEVRRKVDKIVADEQKTKRICAYADSIAWTTNDYSPFAELESIGSTITVVGKPSLLQLRTAKQRTTFFRWSHKPLFTIFTRIVRKPSASKNLLTTRYEERMLIRAQNKFISYGLFTAEVAVIYPETRLPYVVLLEIKYAEKRRLVERRATLTDLPSQLMLNTSSPVLQKNSNALRTFPTKLEGSKNTIRLFDKNASVKTRKRLKTQTNFALFRGTFRGIVKVQYAVYQAKIEQKGRHRLNERRGEVWQLLTSKYFLKIRFFKNWLKERKRFLIRSNWSEIPEVIFKERRTRVRLFEWIESDEHFYREGWKNAFRLYPSERALAPWLQPLRLLRTAANTAHGEYRRYAFPREQKRWKARQYYRKSRATLDPKNFYVKGRRWPRVRKTAYRRARSLFEFRNTHSAQTHFKKISKYTTKTTGFSRNALGLYNRLDVNLILLKFFTTVFWARRFAGYGIVKVNTVKATKANHRFLPGDKIEFAWEKIKRAQAIFRHYVSRRKDEDYDRRFILQELPGNYAWHSGFRLLTYKNLPIPEDVPDSARLSRWLFDSFRRDAGIGRR